MLKSNNFLVFLYDKEGNQINEIKSKNIIQYKYQIYSNQTILSLGIGILDKLIKTFIFQKIQSCNIEFYDEEGNVIDSENYHINDLSCEATGSLIDQQDRFFAYNLKLDIIEKDLVEENNNQTENITQYEQ